MSSVRHYLEKSVQFFWNNTDNLGDIFINTYGISSPVSSTLHVLTYLIFLTILGSGHLYVSQFDTGGNKNVKKLGQLHRLSNLISD